MATSSKGLKGVKRRANKNVSVSPLTRQDKLFLKSLTVETSTRQSKHGNAKAVCWNYYGELMYDPGDGKKPYVLDDRLFCSLCLADIQKQKGLLHNATAESHISKISNFSAQTSTGNLNTHLSSKHAIETMPEDKLNKIVGYFRSYTKHGVASQSPPKQHEFNRDLVLWFCRDLMPFTAVNKSGFLDFFDKYMPMKPPSDSTLSSTGLNDLYTAACSQVKKLLNDVNAVCIMLDGWTDRYKALSYNAIRVSFIKEWKFYVVTLNCEVLVHHTGENLANEVNRILGKFFCDQKGLPKKKLFITTCHDGAANVMKASRLLRSEHVQHCMGHCLHLLLSVDGLNTVGEIKDLLEKCRNIVTSLHFKGSVIDDEKASVADKAMIDRLSDVAEFLGLDEQFPLDPSDSVHVEKSVSEAPDDCNSSSTTSATTVLQRDSTAITSQATGSVQVQRIAGHQTLKQFVCTRWNSNLTMISSILDLKSEVHNALLKTGNSHMCLLENELMLLEELHKFLEPFLEFTELVSSSAGAVLSLQPMMKTRIKKLCQTQPGDDLCIQQLKGAVMRNIEKRLPVSDTVKIYQILDPETRTIFTITDALKLLNAALARIKKRGCLPSSEICVSANQDGLLSGSDSPTSKRRRLKQEMIREMRAGIEVSGDVDCSHGSTSDAVLENELRTYMALMPQSKYQDNALFFWKDHQHMFPLLSQLAAIYLGISASSVPVECLFSTAGLILNGKRSSLKPDKVNKIVFLHDNFNLIKEYLDSEPKHEPEPGCSKSLPDALGAELADKSPVESDTD